MKEIVPYFVIGEMIMGFLQWFPIGDKDLVEATVLDLKELGASELRTGFSWADWDDESRNNPARMSGREWYGWLYPRLKAENLDILPNFLYTPLDKALADKEGVRRTSHPPKNPDEYARFVEAAVRAHGDCFDHVELLNEPHLKQEWNFELDPDYSIYARCIKGGAECAHALGKRVVLGGTVIHHPDWLIGRVQQGILEHIDVVGVHAFQYFVWGAKHSDKPVAEYARDYKAALAERGFKDEIWLTETGFPTQGDPEASEERQVEIFRSLLDQEEIPRVYWWSITDLPPEAQSYTESQIGFREPLFYHFGLKTWDGRPKLLYQKIASGEYALNVPKVLT